MTLRALPVAAKVAAFTGAAVVLLFLPHFLSDFNTRRVAYVGIYAIALLGLNLVTGYSGQISLGHGAFMAVGGYTTATLIAHRGIKDLWTIPLAGVLAAIAGYLFGIPALRLSGPYLALATFGIAVATPQIIKKLNEIDVHTQPLPGLPGPGGEAGLTGGSQGLQLFGLPDLTGAVSGVHVLGRALSPDEWLFYLCWTIALFMFLLAWALAGSRVGRAWRAVRDSELAAASSGLSLAHYKTLAFGVSAFFAGVAGSLLAIADTNVAPSSFQVTLSITLVIGLAVGGLGWLPGVVVGAAFVEYLPIEAQHISKDPGAPGVVYGVVLIVVMLLLPTGVGGLFRRAVRPLTSRLYTRSQSDAGQGAALGKGA